MQRPYSASLRLVTSQSTAAAVSSRRRLLDVEQLRVSTDADGRVLGALNGSALVELRLLAAGRFSSAEAERAALNGDVDFIVSCDSLVLRSVPGWALGVAACLLLVVSAVVRWGMPRLIRSLRTAALLPSGHKRP